MANNDTGDIILRSEGSKFNKKWLIVGGIIAAAILAIAVAALNITTPLSSKYITKLFEEYYQVIVDGPTDSNEDVVAVDVDEAKAGDENEAEVEENSEEESPEDDWFIFNDAGTLTASEREKYADSLYEKYDNLQQAILEHINTLEPSEEISDIRSTMESYAGILAYVIYMLDLPDIEEGLQDIYLNDGLQAAQSYVDEKVASSDNELFSVGYDSMRKYLNSRINTLNFYSQNSCINSTDIDEVCVSLLYDEENAEYLDLLDSETINYENLDANFGMIRTLFYGMTEDIKDLVENIDV